MNTIDYNAYYRAGLLDGFQSRGMTEKQAEFFVKQLELDATGSMNREAFEEGYKEAMAKSAKGFAVVPVDDVEDADADEEEPEADNESIWDKMKRWGLMAGIGAAGFGLGRYSRDIANFGSNLLGQAGESVNADARRDAASSAPAVP